MSVKAKNKTVPLALGEKIKKVLANYVITQFILMIIVSLLVWGILALLNIKYAMVLGVFTGVLSIIPNYGMVISSFLIALVAIFDKVVFLSGMPPFVEGVAVIIILIALNKLVDLLLAPLFLGKTNKINPLLLILVVISGTILFGVPGAILSVPLLLVVKTILEHFNIRIDFKK